MNELLDEMEALRRDRATIQRALDVNTIRMRHAVLAALSRGLHAPTIARALGVTKRTVYNWSK